MEVHVCDWELESRSRRIKRTRPALATLQLWRPVRATEYFYLKQEKKKKCNVRQGTVAQACGPRTLEAESRTSLKVGDQPGLSVEFNTSQGSTVRSCLKTAKKQNLLVSQFSRRRHSAWDRGWDLRSVQGTTRWKERNNPASCPLTAIGTPPPINK